MKRTADAVSIAKRASLKLLCFGMLSAMALNMGGCTKLKTIFRKIKGRLQPAVDLPSDAEREIGSFPSNGEHVAVETALNSRCSSDDDGDPKLFHWGMFDNATRLLSEQVEKIIACSSIARFTDKKMRVDIPGNIVSFVVDNRVTGILRDWLMVESGMQQQAVGLSCAALGCGNVPLNQGKDGTPRSEEDLVTISMRIDSMKPSFNGSYWSAEAPAYEAPWLKGNLPDPVRKGGIPLLTALKNSAIQKDGVAATMQTIGQLLWAARGRTPHFYKSMPWGMTIPTWGGDQNISSAYFIIDSTVYKYVNWDKDRPTHSLKITGQIGEDLFYKIKQSFPSWNSFILLNAQEIYARSLWEIGYQLQNLLVQAYALDIGYSAKILNEEEKKIFKAEAIQRPVALMALKTPSFQLGNN